MDLVSVIIPYFKKKDTILSSINSVLDQTYKNFEIIIKPIRYIINLQTNGGPCWGRTNYPCNVNAVLNR